TSLGAKKVMIGIGSAWAVQIGVIVAAGALVACLWWPDKFAYSWRAVALRMAILVLFVRFAVPAMVVLNQLVYDAFLAERFQVSYSALEQTRIEVEALQANEPSAGDPAGSQGFLSKLGRWYDRTAESFNIEARIAEYRQKFTRASEHIVNLIVVFVLQTVLFPLLLLWLGVRLASMIVHSGER
ncbi:MAG: hypothetical protein AAF420_09490, partial [Pseudomonadota bacterium]